MISSRPQFFLSLSMALFCAACNSGDKPATEDSTEVVESKPSPPAAVAVNPGWDSVAAGSAMLLSTPDNMATTAVVLPYLTDRALGATTSFALNEFPDTQFELFGSKGVSGTTTLALSSQPMSGDGCASWPAGNLSPVPRKSWRVGFRKGAARGLSLDSIQEMTQADSSFITSETVRLAAASVEGDDPEFRGLPFATQRLYRFRLGDVIVVVADVIRKINQEASPREEHVLMVAEQSAPSKGYVLAFQSRAAGLEELVRTNEILGAVKFTRGRPAIILTFDYEEGDKVALLERVANQQWRITWRSAFTNC